MKKPQLFLLHFAGGNCYSYQFMLPLLTGFEVYSLELPGRGKRMNENLIHDLISAKRDIFNQIISKLDGSNFIIYGHSMGAIVALQVACMLETAKKFPSFILVSGSAGTKTIENPKKLALKNENLIKSLVKFGGMPIEILENQDFLDFYLPILRADFQIVNSEAIKIILQNTSIYAIMGDEEEQVKHIENWKNYTKSAFKYKVFEGGHFFIYHHGKEIVDTIWSCYNTPDFLSNGY